VDGTTLSTPPAQSNSGPAPIASQSSACLPRHLAVAYLFLVRSLKSGIWDAISYVFARWRRALRSSIKLCLKSYSYPTGDPLRLLHQRVSSPHPCEQGFLIQMNAVETRGVRRAAYSSLTVWSSVARAMRKNRRLRRSYISPKEFV
jgi:hypothetical protein